MQSQCGERQRILEILGRSQFQSPDPVNCIGCIMKEPVAVPLALFLPHPLSPSPKWRGGINFDNPQIFIILRFPKIPSDEKASIPYPILSFVRCSGFFAGLPGLYR
jgi:hypothetical protein